MAPHTEMQFNRAFAMNKSTSFVFSTHSQIAQHWSALKALFAVAVMLGCFTSPSATAQVISVNDKPDYQLANPPVRLPDLFTVLFSYTHDETNENFRIYDFSALVANNSPARAENFPVLIGMKVLGSKDQTKYPIGKKIYNGYGLSYASIPGYSSLAVHGQFAIPLEVSKCEIYVVVDRRIENLEDHWENDTGAALRGYVMESNENNNIEGPYVLHFTGMASPLPNSMAK